MGDLAEPPPHEVAGTLALANAVLDAVREDEEWPSPFDMEPYAPFGYRGSDADTATFRFAQDLVAANAEIERLRTRQQELLTTLVRITNETPFPDEVKNWIAQRAKLLVMIGSLRAELAEAKRP